MDAQGPGPNPNRERAVDQHDQTVDQRDSFIRNGWWADAVGKKDEASHAAMS
jgi:hypothetical protein